ncbi:MAG: hypothetical protein MUO26_09235 [Methanotrichaceae archaeon]|nr:hypothetical protein [Methanotrichaceae archaeon]
MVHALYAHLYEEDNTHTKFIGGRLISDTCERRLFNPNQITDNDSLIGWHDLNDIQDVLKKWL